MFMLPLRRCSALHLRRPPFPLRAPPPSQCPRPRAEKYRNYSSGSSTSSSPGASTSTRPLPKLNGWLYVVPTTVLVVGGAGVLAYNYNQPFRHTVLAVARCSRIGGTLSSALIPRLRVTPPLRGRCPRSYRLQAHLRQDVCFRGGTRQCGFAMPYTERGEGP